MTSIITQEEREAITNLIAEYRLAKSRAAIVCKRPPTGREYVDCSIKPRHKHGYTVRVQLYLDKVRVSLINTHFKRFGRPPDLFWSKV